MSKIAQSCHTGWNWGGPELIGFCRCWVCTNKFATPNLSSIRPWKSSHNPTSHHSLRNVKHHWLADFFTVSCWKNWNAAVCQHQPHPVIPSVTRFGECLPLRQNIQKSWAIFRVNLLIGKILYYFGRLCMPLGKFSLM